jgi:hypothetical protein
MMASFKKAFTFSATVSASCLMRYAASCERPIASKLRIESTSP